MSKKISTAWASSSTGDGFVDENGIKYHSPQRKNWDEAVDRYYKLSRGALDIIEAKSIIILLGQSLYDLFGANYMNSGNSHTPGFKEYIDIVFPKRGWDLKLDDINLYNDFIDSDDCFSNYYNDKAKHHDISKRNELDNLSWAGLNKQMGTVQNVWIWFTKKQFPNAGDEMFQGFNNVFNYLG